jgi:hypothetical protein
LILSWDAEFDLDAPTPYREESTASRTKGFSMTLPASPIAATPRKTALNAAHRALKAKMVDFGGWDMPVE